MVFPNKPRSTLVSIAKLYWLSHYSKFAVSHRISYSQDGLRNMFEQFSIGKTFSYPPPPPLLSNEEKNLLKRKIIANYERLDYNDRSTWSLINMRPIDRASNFDSTAKLFKCRWLSEPGLFIRVMKTEEIELLRDSPKC